MSIPLSLAVKLASIVVHADEFSDPVGSHAYDLIALRGLIEDDEVLDWIGKLGPLAPGETMSPKRKRGIVVTVERFTMNGRDRYGIWIEHILQEIPVEYVRVLGIVHLKPGETRKVRIVVDEADD